MSLLIYKRQLGAKATSQQKMKLLELLEANPELVTDSRVTKKKLATWKSFANILNAMNGSVKTGGKWLKYWYDQRAYVRERCVDVNQTENGSNSSPKPMTDYERRVLNLFPQAAEKLQSFTVEYVDCEDELITPKVEVDDDHIMEPHANAIEELTNPIDQCSELLIENIKEEEPWSDTSLSLPPPDPPIQVRSSTVPPAAPSSSVSSSAFPRKRKHIENNVHRRKCISKDCKFDSEIDLKMLAVMESNEKFNREMKIKKLEIEEKKLAALNRLIDVVSKGFENIIDMQFMSPTPD